MNRKRKLALALALLLALCSGCSAQDQKGSAGQPEPSLTPSAAPTAPEAESPAPTEELPAESAPSLTLPGTDGEQPAMRYESALGYSILCPETGVTVKTWDGGETFAVDAAPGTYLAVSTLEAANVNEAAAGLQFEHGIEDEPRGFLFGSAGYAGVRMEERSGGLVLEYILLRANDTVYLIERAVFTGGEDYAALLAGMLDSFAINGGEAE